MRVILSTPASHVYVRLKTSGTGIKMAKEITNNQQNIIWWNVYRDNNFHSGREVLGVKCLGKSWVR